MADDYSPILRLRRPEVGQNNNTWGTLLNEDVIDLLDMAIAGQKSIALTNVDVTLTETDGEDNEARAHALVFTGTLTGNVVVTLTGITSSRRSWLVRNTTTGGFTVTLKVGAGSTTIVLPQDSLVYAIKRVNADGLQTVRAINGAFLTEAQSWSAAQVSTPVALTDAATVAINLALGNNFTLTAGGNRTLGNPSSVTVGQYFDILIVGNSTADRTISFGSNYRGPAGALPSIVVDDTKACLISCRVAASNRIMVIGAISDYDLT